MLVLTRRLNEVIMLGDEIEITIVGISDNKVRVGINAPPNIPVHRKEVYEAIHREKQTILSLKNLGVSDVKPKKKKPD